MESIVESCWEAAEQAGPWGQEAEEHSRGSRGSGRTRQTRKPHELARSTSSHVSCRHNKQPTQIPLQIITRALPRTQHSPQAPAAAILQSRARGESHIGLASTGSRRAAGALPAPPPLAQRTQLSQGLQSAHQVLTRSQRPLAAAAAAARLAAGPWPTSPAQRTPRARVSAPSAVESQSWCARVPCRARGRNTRTKPPHTHLQHGGVGPQEGNSVVQPELVGRAHVGELVQQQL
jgi:hypothetical protein